MKIKHLVVISLSLAIASCGDNKQVKNNIAQDTIKADISTKIDEMTEFLFHNVLANLPPPTSLANEIKNSKIKYNEQLIIPTNHETKFTTSSHNALAYGAYSVNLCYLAAYDQTNKIPMYVKMLKGLADKIGALEIIEKSMGANPEKIIANHDSLIAMIDNSYSGIESYLENNERLETATFTLVGMWVEANY